MLAHTAAQTRALQHNASVTAMGYWGQARVTGHEATRGTEQDRQIGTFALSRARKLAKRPESS